VIVIDYQFLVTLCIVLYFNWVWQRW